MFQYSRLEELCLVFSRTRPAVKSLSFLTRPHAVDGWDSIFGYLPLEMPWNPLPVSNAGIAFLPIGTPTAKIFFFFFFDLRKILIPKGV